MPEAIEGVPVLLRIPKSELHLVEQYQLDALRGATWCLQVGHAIIPVDASDVFEFFVDDVWPARNGCLLILSCASTVKARPEIQVFLNKHGPLLSRPSSVERLLNWLCRPARREPPIPF